MYVFHQPLGSYIMVTHAASAAKSVETKKPRSTSTFGTPKPAQDACAFLDADHKAVKKLFQEYEAATTSKARSALAAKEALARKICRELTAHATVEEEIFSLPCAQPLTTMTC